MKNDLETLNALRTKLPTAWRQGRKGEQYEYIPTKYVSDRLTEVWGLQWELEVIDKGLIKDHLFVHVRLHYPTQEGPKFKDAFGGAKFEEAIGVGDGFKKAASLGLKKAATLVGIDLADEETVFANESQIEEVVKLLESKGTVVSDDMKKQLAVMPLTEINSLKEKLQA